MIIDAHGLKIQGRGFGMFLPKFLGGGGGQGFQEKLPGGVHLFCVLPPSTLTPPLCASMIMMLNEVNSRSLVQGF
jgi:hypothetical protein